MTWLLHWLAVHTGTINEGSPYYGFFSGFGSDLQEFGIFALVFGAWRRHNCHVRGCPRIGKHPVDGTPWTVCRRHHPGIQDARPTRAQVAADAKAAK